MLFLVAFFLIGAVTTSSSSSSTTSSSSFAIEVSIALKFLEFELGLTEVRVEVRVHVLTSLSRFSSGWDVPNFAMDACIDNTLLSIAGPTDLKKFGTWPIAETSCPFDF